MGLRIKPSVPDQTDVTTSSLSGINGALDLIWSHSPAATRGYVVDWSPAVRLGPARWLKLPPDQVSVQVPAGESAQETLGSVQV